MASFGSGMVSFVTLKVMFFVCSPIANVTVPLASEWSTPAPKEFVTVEFL